MCTVCIPIVAIIGNMCQRCVNVNMIMGYCKFYLIHVDYWTFTSIDTIFGSPTFYTWGLKSTHLTHSNTTFSHVIRLLLVLTCTTSARPSITTNVHRVQLVIIPVKLNAPAVAWYAVPFTMLPLINVARNMIPFDSSWNTQVLLPLSISPCTVAMAPVSPRTLPEKKSTVNWTSC